jgi:hypothetical protein
MAGMPSGGNPSYFDTGDWGVVGTAASGLANRTQANVEATLKGQTQASPGWGGASGVLFAGLDSSLPFPVAILKALGEALMGAVIGGVSAVGDVLSAVGTWAFGVVEDLGQVIIDVGALAWNLLNDAAAAVGNIADVVVDGIGSTLQGLWDFIVGGLSGLGLGGLGGAVSTGADVERVALDVAENVTQMQSKISALQTAAANGAFSGNSSFIDFSLRPNTASLGNAPVGAPGAGSPDFSQTYSGGGTPTLGIVSGKGAWTGSWNTSPRTGVAVYTPVQTQGNFQKIGVAFASAPTSHNGSNPAINYILGRMNAAGTEYVFVELMPNSCRLGCVNGGVTTYDPNGPSTLYGSFKAGAAYWLECGTTGGDNVFRVHENNRIILTWTDSGNVAAKDASHRYVGVAGYTFANGSYNTKPATMAALAMADNTPLDIRGSGFRRYRASGTSVNQSSGQNLIANNFFDTGDKITDDLTYDGGSNNKITVSVAGWYMVQVKIRHSGDLNNGQHEAQILLYVNGTAVQSGPDTWGPGTIGAAGGLDLSGTFVQYLNAGDYVQPGISTSLNPLPLIGGSSGVQTHYSVVFLNNQKPS